MGPDYAEPRGCPNLKKFEHEDEANRRADELLVFGVLRMNSNRQSTSCRDLLILFSTPK